MGRKRATNSLDLDLVTMALVASSQKQEVVLRDTIAFFGQLRESGFSIQVFLNQLNQTPMSLIAKNLRFMRRFRDLTAAELERASAATRNLIGKVESSGGPKKLAPLQVINLAAVLRIDPMVFLREDLVGQVTAAVDMKLAELSETQS